MRSRVEIGAILRAQVERARSRARGASLVFDDLIRSVPSGIPSPDGSLRLRQAEAERYLAINQLCEAVRRLNDFVIHGAIPDELKDEP